jgi:hypothetical protein
MFPMVLGEFNPDMGNRVTRNILHTTLPNRIFIRGN